MKKILILLMSLFISAFIISPVSASNLDPDDRGVSWGCEYKEGSDDCTTFDPIEVSFKNVYENPSIDESIHYIGYTISGNKIFEVYNPDKNKYTNDTFSYEKHVDKGDSFNTKVRFPITEDELKKCADSGEKQCEYSASVAVQVKYCNIEVEPKDCYWHGGAEIKLKGIVDVKQPEPVEIKIVKQEMRYWDSEYDPLFDWTLQVNRKPADTPWDLSIDTSCNGHADNHGGNFSWKGVEIYDNLELKFGNGVYREYIDNPQDSVKLTIKNNKGDVIYTTNLKGPTCYSEPKVEPTPTPNEAESDDENTNVGGVVTNSNNSNDSDDDSSGSKKDDNVFESSDEYNEMIKRQQQEKDNNQPTPTLATDQTSRIGSIFGIKDKKDDTNKEENIEDQESNTQENDVVQNQDSSEFDEAKEQNNTKRFALIASLITFITAAGASVYYFFGDSISQVITNLKA